MTILLIILLILLIIYLAYQNRKLQGNSDDDSFTNEPRKIIFDSEEEDLIADKDLAIRERNEAQQEALSFSNKLKLKNQEITRKDNEIQRLKSEKDKVEIALNDKIQQNKQQHTEQLRQINLLFDPQAQDYKSIDFNGLYALLEKISQKDLPGSFPGGDN